MSSDRDEISRRSLPVLGNAHRRDGARANAPRELGPDAASPPGLSRRELFRLMGASAALAGIGACAEEPHGLLMPFANQPPEITPGTSSFYATSMVIDGFATGVLVESRDGRPVKIEGNPDHPASLGTAGVFEQASILQLYDPQRSRGVLFRELPSSWRSFFDAVVPQEDMDNLWFLLPPTSSPHLLQLIERVRERHPRAQFAFDAPLARTDAYRGAELVYGRPLETHHDLGAARVVLSLSADFMASGPMHLRDARRFAARRRLDSPLGDMNRLYVVETMPTPTGTLADHRLPVKPSEVKVVAAAILAVVEGRDSRARQHLAGRGLAAHLPWVEAVAADLRAARGESLVLAGDQQPPETHALAHLLNGALGNLGTTMTLSEPVLPDPLAGPDLTALTAAMADGAVETLVLVDVNPVYTAPADLRFAELLALVPNTVHLGLHRNETAARCHWSLPAAHYLESWGDGRAHDGTVSLIQPLIEPLYECRTAAQVLGAFAGLWDADDRDLLVAYWEDALGPAFGAQWRRYVQLGLIPDTALPPVTATPGNALEVTRRALAPGELADGVEIAFEASPVVHDGRFANVAWLMELPQPITKLTWDNAVMMSPTTARARGLETEDVVIVRHGDREVRGAVLVVPGHADDAVTLPLGFGRQGDEELARGVGFSAYQLRTTEARHFARGAELRAAGGTWQLARAQLEFRQHDRHIALRQTLDGYRANPDFTEPYRGILPSLLPRLPAEAPRQWGMSIDTSICTGCSSCVVACQAENNIPVVGKEDVGRGRIMHWLRIDDYYGPEHERRLPDTDDPERIHQPMLCQHCEDAPCEYVCPTYATVHSPDGLNEMVYNRCIGTRFCSNNCPYKVRRFNWFGYNDDPGTTALQFNPEVTVRDRGVMEKCTFCVQRIRRGEIAARLSGDTEPAEIRTACQQACPTGAIQFGDLSDERSLVSRWADQPRMYNVLHELGTRPRVHYLAKIINRNPRLA